MSERHPSTWSRALAITRPVFQSNLRWKAWGFLGLLLGLALAVSGLNVVNSYVGRDFMSALADRRRSAFLRMAVLYLGVFGASSVVVVFYRYTEQRLGLVWRRWLTIHFLGKYLAGHTYYRLIAHGEIDNPDQRISEDVKTFTTTLLSVAIMVLNSTLALLAFAGVLWSISPWLALGALGYSALGCGVTLVLGRRLVGLNNDQYRKEADFRYELIRVRERAYAVALSGQEGREGARLGHRLKALAANFQAIVTVDRNIGFFVSLYNSLTPIVPVLIVASLYIRGQIELGVVTQAAMAFAQVTGALTLIVTQIDQLSAFAAVIARLGSFWEAIDEIPGSSRTAIALAEDDSRVAFENLTLRAPKDGRVLVEGLSLEVGRANRVMISGPNGAGKDALFRASAGLWEVGGGRIVRPGRDAILFLTQQPFAPSGSLRDALLAACRHCDAKDAALVEALEAAQLGPFLEGVGGLDAERDWSDTLSLGDQQRLALAGLLAANPPFAFLHGATNALGPEGAEAIYSALAKTSIAYISIEDYDNLGEFHDMTLELRDDGAWDLEPKASEAAGSRPEAAVGADL